MDGKATKREGMTDARLTIKNRAGGRCILCNVATRHRTDLYFRSVLNETDGEYGWPPYKGDCEND